MSIDQVGAEFASRMAAVRVSAGAETDLGAKVYRGLRKINDDMIPCCVIVEGAATSADGDSAADVQLSAPIAVQAYVPCDPANPNVAAHAALRDMKRAIWPTVNGRVELRLGSRVPSLAFGSQDIAPRADGAAFVLAVLHVEVEIAEDLSNP